jgi:hypothetical protein
MAFETCFRSCALHAPGGSSKDKLLAGSSSSAFAPSSKRTAVVVAPPLSIAVRRPRLVCQASNALNEGTYAACTLVL